MKAQLENIYNSAKADIEKAQSITDIDDIRLKYLSRKGEFNSIKKGLKDLSDEDKRTVGAFANQITEELEGLLKQNTVASNKSLVNNIMTGSRDILDLDANDKDYLAFVENITTEDSNKTTSVTNYIAKLVKDSYEKGKKDALKDEMGNFGKNKGQGSSSKDDEIGKLGKELASRNVQKEQYDYFSENKK